jgi:hypothetical protein
MLLLYEEAFVYRVLTIHNPYFRKQKAMEFKSPIGPTYKRLILSNVSVPSTTMISHVISLFVLLVELLH